jgi:hypothetical protein
MRKAPSECLKEPFLLLLPGRLSLHLPQQVRRIIQQLPSGVDVEQVSWGREVHPCSEVDKSDKEMSLGSFG